MMPTWCTSSPGESVVKSKEKRNYIFALQLWVCQEVCVGLFCTLFFAPSHSCQHLFQAASLVKQRKRHQTKKSHWSPENVPLTTSPSITAVRRELISSWDGYRQADSRERWRRQRGATGVRTGPQPFVSWQRHNLSPLVGGLVLEAMLIHTHRLSILFYWW